MLSDKILDVCAYHRRDFDLVLVRSRPHDTQAVLASLQNACQACPASSLGSLDSLPTELLCIILRDLDVLSYFQFRHVNRRACALATTAHEYQSVARHGLEGLRGLLRAGLAPLFTMGDLYSPLIREECVLCGSFGGFLFLPTVTRCCIACIQTSPDLRVMCTSTFSRLAKISTRRLRRVLGSELRTVPGSYSMLDKRTRRPKHLIAVQTATAKLEQLGILDQDRSRALLSWDEQEGRQFMASTAFPWYDPHNGQVDDGISCKGCQVRFENRLEVGVADDRDRVFSRSSYLSHFQSCTEAQELWTQSEGGTKAVWEPEFTRRGGFFNELDSDGLPR
ncbi:hypothetical protein B0I35DRAFT_449768 [Stachybotrys elegans]|uniref:F-box domain-containing protein n=1 Tax=Stachybotrys elegans TaxID=80388 RepID=A0A8K0WU77_9HYPO|nr:hypothetical protein B0I35DRAFT_449768 [Stachybotrys elegans]